MAGTGTQPHFYPRPPRGGRQSPLVAVPVGVLFLSTPSARRATHIKWGAGSILLFLSTPSARRATRLRRADQLRQDISIHALREEGDAWRSAIKGDASPYFYPRPPRGGRPRPRSFPEKVYSISIHALREEGDRRGLAFSSILARISIHALREEGDPQGWYPPALPPISIHALREEGDIDTILDSANIWLFLSTPSARRATFYSFPQPARLVYFYPRPPRGGRPTHRSPSSRRWDNFYPRPPRGGRRTGQLYACALLADFYPRPPRGGRQGSKSLKPNHKSISIHALREEGDQWPCVRC